jgi:acyl-CoA reductase-like NAD-dependent aldehyde dehydrogenase
VPAIIEKSANTSKAVADIITGKTFDNGTICASEQSVICERQIHETVIDEFKQRNAYFVNQEEQRLLENYMFPQRCINSEIVGKSPQFIAKRAGFKIPEEATVIEVTP